MTEPEIAELARLTGDADGLGYGYTYSDLTTRLIPNAVLDALPRPAAHLERISHLAAERRRHPHSHRSSIPHERLAAFNLHDTLLRKQNMLVASLAGLRGVISHKGGRGDVPESEWRKVIDEFLPNRYCVSGKTEVIDHTGQVSQQVDIAIHDRHFLPALLRRRRDH